MKKRILITIISIIIFFVTLYWISYSPWSSLKLTEYNNGYGTFDMKSYNAAIVYEVLDRMEPQGFDIYQKYFLGDYLFILNLALLQILLLRYFYAWTKSKIIYVLITAVPIARGIFDAIENTLLLYILRTFPQRYDRIAGISHIATTIKLGLVNLWNLLFAAGFIITIIITIRKKVKASNK